jgi:hypothetical protein
MDIVTLAKAGASAMVAAMATEVWTWARTEMSSLFGYGDRSKVAAENERLDALVGELATSTERDVHNRLWGFLEARLADNPAIMDRFLELTEQIYGKLGIEPPALNDGAGQQLSASGSVGVQSGRHTHAYMVTAPSSVNWTTMTGPEAARRLEAMGLTQAVEALTEMDPAAAVRRLSFVTPDRTAMLLSHLDAAGTATLLAKMPSRQADLLARMEPSRGAVALNTMNAEWVVARLAEMDLDRALVLLGALGTKRTENLLDAMRRQEATTLLAAVSKIMAGQAAIRRKLDLTQQRAEEPVAQARQEAQETIERAKTNGAREINGVRPTPDPSETPLEVGQADGDESQILRKRIADHLNACYPAELTARQLRKAVGGSSESIDSALRNLVGAGLVEMTRGGRAPRYLGFPVR